VVESASKTGLPKGGQGGLLQEQGAKWSDSGRLGAESHPAGDALMKKGLAMSQTAEKGVQ
jgi:hypothetical protein